MVELEGTFEPLVLSLGEWLSETLDLFSEVLSLIMELPALRFFAVFGFFLVALYLALRLIGEGKSM